MLMGERMVKRKIARQKARASVHRVAAAIKWRKRRLAGLKKGEVKLSEISNLDQLLDYAILVSEGKAAWVDAEFVSGFAAVSVKVCGSGWDKRIDVRGARFILELQEGANSLYAEFPGKLSQQAPLIKADLKEGSNELVALFDSFIREVIGKLDPQEIISLIKYGILCATGVWSVGKVGSLLVADRKDKRQAQAEDKKDQRKAELDLQIQQTQARTLEVLEKTVNKISGVLPDEPLLEQEYAKPIRNYTGKLGKHDRLGLQGGPPLPVNKVKPLFKRKRRPSSGLRYVACDGSYECLGLNLEQKVPRLEIEQGGIKQLAIIARLSPRERGELLKKIDKRMDEKEMPFRIVLQVDAYFTNAGIKYCTVVGMGKQREDLHQHRLEDIPGNVTKPFDAGIKKQTAQED
ncbi:hypothetical protein LJC36_00145 [Desulfovibrio sp. OttesenSCG-928-C14]|nr:hypothetical protein [Desulfovibrio sp. OttesenSCG-928-C14]